MYSPTLPPKRSNNDFKWWVSNTNMYIQLTYTPKIVCSIYPTTVTQRYILKYIYSPTMRPKGTQKLTNLHSSPHDISNTNIYIQLTFIPPIVGSIYSIQIYISTNLYSQTLRPKGAQKLQQYIQPPSVGLIYPIVLATPTYMYSTDIYCPNWWLHISNKYLYF